MTVFAQSPQFSQGFANAGQNQAHDPAEFNAYTVAIATPDPAARVSAIQQFLIRYPNSSMRQAAISQLLVAQRQNRSDGATPPGMNRFAPPQPAPPAMSSPAPASAPVETATAFGPPADSLLQQPPKPAVVAIAPHSLSIKADNSSLLQILHDISSKTGMTVDGLSQDERIFGAYGPGDARDVLLSLLEGSGYNVVMLGDTAGGAPRQLTLSQRTAMTVAQNSAAPVPRNTDDDSDDIEQEAPPMPEPVQTPAPNPLPAENGQQPPRSPQEIMQNLQRMRQQQQNQQPNQPQEQQ